MPILSLPVFVKQNRDYKSPPATLYFDQPKVLLVYIEHPGRLLDLTVYLTAKHTHQQLATITSYVSLI